MKPCHAFGLACRIRSSPCGMFDGDIFDGLIVGESVDSL